MHLFRRFGAAALLLLPTIAARAGTPLPPRFDDLRITPSPAVAGQPLTLLVRWRPCSPVGATSITRQGNLILVTQQDSLTTCWTPPPPPTQLSYALGGFAPGDYVLRYTADYFDGTSPVTPSADLPFSVAGAPTETIPALTPPLLGMLALGLALTAGPGLRRRRS